MTVYSWFGLCMCYIRHDLRRKRHCYSLDKGYVQCDVCIDLEQAASSHKYHFLADGTRSILVSMDDLVREFIL